MAKQPSEYKNYKKHLQYKAYAKYYETYGTFHKSTPENVKHFIQQNIYRQEAKTDEEYGRYVKAYYKQQKQLKQSGVNVYIGHKQGLFVEGEAFQGWRKGQLMSKYDYYLYKEKYYKDRPFDDVSTIVATKQFNLLDEKLGKTLQSRLHEIGIDYNLDLIRARQLPQEVWDKMQTYVDEEGLEMGYFFGS